VKRLFVSIDESSNPLPHHLVVDKYLMVCAGAGSLWQSSVQRDDSTVLRIESNLYVCCESRGPWSIFSLQNRCECGGEGEKPVWSGVIARNLQSLQPRLYVYCIRTTPK
jgi:hypothetical protein